MLTSAVCKFADFATPWYREWAASLPPSQPHRKHWEWAVLTQALFERYKLRPGRRGIGFAVGQEPLASLFASLGAEIDATDLDGGEVSERWVASNQHAADRDALHHPGIVDRATFDRNVRFFPADMKDLSALPSDTYDFMWSSCAMEHLGSLEAGLDFVRDAMRLLKPGGVACHTTEFNVSDADDTLGEGWNILYRERDIRRLAGALRRRFCLLEPMDFALGDDPQDILYDSEPWGHRNHLHLKLEYGGFICTSAVLICRRYA